MQGAKGYIVVSHTSEEDLFDIGRPDLIAHDHDEQRSKKCMSGMLVKGTSEKRMNDGTLEGREMLLLFAGNERLESRRGLNRDEKCTETNERNERNEKMK